MDKFGYPDKRELARIRKWDAIGDPLGLLEYVKQLWSDYGSYTYNAETGELALITGGWSGNESIIAALERNLLFWALFWQKSERGGGYWFRVEHP